ncbi:uncharacterized protein LOC105895688 [Clupea harengus]|uniref:Uncharacterized protein LOC105895688 n=1 Tax=Clupea harengus TaxID=7950 RepID=A0A6P3VPE7_CLUHA|nr:uncharacterized protein LOC105895688 [Clupea harengus]
MVVEMRVTLILTEYELQNTKDLLHKIEADNEAELTAVKNRLAAAETEAAAQEAELVELKTRMDTDEAQVETGLSAIHTESQSIGAAAADTATTELDDSDELRELRDMVMELRVTLRFTQDDLHKIEAENDAQDTEMTAVKTRLAASETEVVNLKKEAAAQTADLRSVIERLAATETDMEAVKKDTAAQEAELVELKTRMDTGETQVEIRLSASETEVEKLKMEHAAQEAELTAVKNRLAATETEVVNLKKEIREKPKVAFSAGLTNSGRIESGTTELNLVFTRIITNVGQAYNDMTGYFTAPVRGVYYFRFTVMDFPEHYVQIRMYKNGKEVMFLWERNSEGPSYVSSGVTLQLEAGDVVNMRLPKGYKLTDSSNNHCTFSGFLLFPL